MNESTGKKLWIDNKADLGHAIKTKAGVTIANGYVYAGTTDNYLLALNASTGKLVWKVLITKGVIGSSQHYLGAEATPLVFNREVIVGETLGD